MAVVNHSLCFSNGVAIVTYWVLRLGFAVLIFCLLDLQFPLVYFYTVSFVVWPRPSLTRFQILVASFNISKFRFIKGCIEFAPVNFQKTLTTAELFLIEFVF